MLNFNYDKFDFWKVYDSIKHFYPIGVKKDEGNLYYSYPGLKELEAIIIDNIHDDKHFEERWECFTLPAGRYQHNLSRQMREQKALDVSGNFTEQSFYANGDHYIFISFVKKIFRSKFVYL
jgi:hypothetical protein